MIEKANVLRRIVAYLDSFPLSRDLRHARLVSHSLRSGMVSLRELQSATETVKR